MLCKISFLIHLAFYLHYKATITENTRKDAIFFLTKTKPAVKKNLFPENCYLFETDSEDYCTDILFEQFSSPREETFWKCHFNSETIVNHISNKIRIVL